MTDKKSALQEFSEICKSLHKKECNEGGVGGVKELIWVCMEELSEALNKDLSDMREMIQEESEERYAMGGGGAGGKHPKVYGVFGEGNDPLFPFIEELGKTFAGTGDGSEEFLNLFKLDDK